MKVGIYGGSFNPIHFGHIGLAKWVLAHTDLDEVWIMVSPNNPLKDSKILADEHERLQAAKEAFKDEQGIYVSDFEFALPRPTYTAFTLHSLTKQYPQHQFSLIIGEDNLHIFSHWRDWRYIASNYRIFVYPRHEKIEAMNRDKNTIDEVNEVAKEIVYLHDAPYFDISSTTIRAQQEM